MSTGWSGNEGETLYGVDIAPPRKLFIFHPLDTGNGIMCPNAGKTAPYTPVQLNDWAEQRADVHCTHCGFMMIIKERKK